MSLELKSIIVNGLSVSYLSRPADSGTVIIFIHGFPCKKEMWRQQLESLPKYIQGIAYDIRGFGNSEAGHGFLSIDLLASDLLNFIEELQLKKVILCGLSMGGYIVLRAFERSPQRFSGLILCDTNAFTDKDEARLKRFALIEKVQSGGKEEFSENFLHQVLYEETLERKEQVVSSIRDMIQQASEKAICAALLAMAARTDTTAVLPQIQIPALIIRGQHDRLMSAEKAEFLKSEIKNSSLAEIAASGHFPNLENPEEFNSRMNDFLEKYFWQEI